MRRFETFDKKAIVKESIENFNKKIFKNEIVWTYIVGSLAKQNKEIYKLLSGFDYKNSHSIFFESQPRTPYVKIEGNSHIDMALGALSTIEETSSLKYLSSYGNHVCFVEAKYLSDMNVKTTHSAIRNQMDRVIENLLCLKDEGDFPEELVFTLLTPRIFKESYGSRIYYYKFYEYKNLLGNENKKLADKIELSKENKRYKYTKEPVFIKKRIDHLNLNWVTFEEIFELVIPEIKGLDITKEKEATIVWENLNRYLNGGSPSDKKNKIRD